MLTGEVSEEPSLNDLAQKSMKIVYLLLSFNKRFGYRLLKESSLRFYRFLFPEFGDLRDLL